MLVETLNPGINSKYDIIAFSQEEEEKICRIVLGDILAKLEMVKACMDLVVKLANWYALENGLRFSQVVQVGILAIIKAAESFSGFDNIDFIDYASQRVVMEMLKIPRLNS